MPRPVTDHLRELFRPGAQAVLLLWKPFVLLQLAGLAIVVGYFNFDPFARWCERLADVKARWGLLFSMVSMSLACSIVPEVFKYLAGVDRRWTRQRGGLVLHNMVLFAIGGITVDLLYRAIAHSFGDSRSPWIVMSKVGIDQLIYTPTIGVPMIAVAYLLRKRKYALSAFREIGWRWYVREVPPVLVTCWAYWFPMTTLMYTLPPKLTFVYGVAASAASATLLTAVAGRNEPRLADGHV